MSRAIHQKFERIAAEISPSLLKAITEVGPIQLRRRNDHPLALVLCRTIAGQQLSGKAANTIWNCVLDSAGGGDFVEHIASIDSSALRACGLSGSKTRAMKAIAEAQSAGLLNATRLCELDHNDRSSELTSIWGVGQWTADMIGIFYFGDHDVWPAGDMTVGKTLERLTSRRRKTARTAERFAPHRSYLAMYMYRIADSGS